MRKLILGVALTALSINTFAAGAMISAQTATNIELMAKSKCEQLSISEVSEAKNYSKIYYKLKDYRQKAIANGGNSAQIDAEIQKAFSKKRDEQLNYARDFGNRLYQNHKEAYSKLENSNIGFGSDAIELIATTMKSIGEAVYSAVVDIGMNNPDATDATYQRLLYNECAPYIHITFR